LRCESRDFPPIEVILEWERGAVALGGVVSPEARLEGLDIYAEARMKQLEDGLRGESIRMGKMMELRT
jgi:hypothetical protein